ncbi:permease [Bifidobacterium sp. LC6]|uniref:Permease n=1 Tax=Bifidobacterium colobi TaxID=2809026 RepID=A0ABS5UWG4_9BIFI|nr:DUF6591 domain-containing protein [Bifidobacterium colobi]MBT1174643.1 permease [Bifidobacterium colobi]
MTNQSDQPTTPMPTTPAQQPSTQPIVQLNGQAGAQPSAQPSPVTTPIVYPNATAGDSAGVPAGGPGVPTNGPAPVQQPQAHKKTSKLAIFAIIVDVLFLLTTVIGLNSWGMLVFFAVLPVLLSGFSLYVTRKDGKVQGRVLAWVAVGLAVVGLIVGSIGVVRAGAKSEADDAAFKESMKVTCEAYSWPSSDLVAQLPQPQATKGKINTESSSLFSISVCDTDAAQYEAYVKSLQEKGFTVEYSKSEDAFTAKNEAGYRVHASVNEYNTNVMDVSIYPPQDSSSDSSTDDSANTDSNSSDGSSTDSSTSTDSNASTGTSDSDFKAAMDSYEKTMNDYVDFMNKYNSEGKPVSMLVDYTKWMKQYNDTMQKFDALNDGSLTDEELQYYIEVQTRVNEKLSTVQ